MLPLCAYKKRLEKKTFTNHQSVSNWTDAKTNEVKKLRKHSKFTVRYNKFLPKKVEEEEVFFSGKSGW